METRIDIGRIFWPLLIGSFVLAVCSVVVAIWISTQPFLREMQHRTLTSAAELNANTAATFLERNLVATRYLANDPVVVAHTTGAVEAAERAIDRLGAIDTPDEMRGVYLFDFLGDPILERTLRAAADPATGTEDFGPTLADMARGPVRRILDESTGDTPPGARFDVVGGTALIAVPVVSFDLVEGVLVSAVDLTALAFTRAEFDGLDIWLSGSDQQRSTFDAIVQPIPSTGLYLHNLTDGREVDRVGYAMLRRGTIAVILSLLLPFAVLAAIGQRGILRPAEDLAASRDVLRRQKKELAELAAIARRADDSIVITDLEGRVRWVNPAFERMTGYTLAEVQGNRPEAVLEPEDRDPADVALLKEAFFQRKAVQLETLNRHKTGPDFWVRLHVSPLQDDDGADYGFVCISNDITKEREDAARIAKAQEAIEYQALHDELTGLPNRRAFNNAMDERMEQGPDALLALIRIDLDNFKAVNDTLGHAAGDAVLERVAQVLREVTRETDLPVRIGGDEFVILLDPRCRVEGACQMAERLRARVADACADPAGTPSVTASVGVATTETGLVDPGDVLAAADTALYTAKEAGRDRVVFYNEDLNLSVVTSRAMETDLRRGIENGEFVPFYQPKVDAATHAVVGVEVLARWHHPRKGTLAPGAFLEAAGRLGLTPQLDGQVMDAALRDIRNLEIAGLEVGHVAFNITAERLTSADLPAVLQATGLKKTRVCLEILESVFLDDALGEVDAQLSRLRAAGVQIEIDDFGSGHASVISMMRIQPDVLKIDGRLVREALNSRQHRDILTAIISIAGALNLSIVAEGVETLAHAELMRDLGCQVLQGYAFARPMPVADLTRMLADGTGGDRKLAS